MENLRGVLLDYVVTTYPQLNASSELNGAIRWCYRSEIPSEFLVERKDENGRVLYSSPELTAVELVQYEHQCGGLSNVATVLAELAEQLDFTKLPPSFFVRCKGIVLSDPYLAERLAWRGGTALHKLHLKPQARYSEDIDLVLINPEPMGPILDRLREVLSFVPDQQSKGKRYNHVLKLRYNSENTTPIAMRIKVEINCNEHFTELGFDQVPFEVKSSWFLGSCKVTAYRFEEMLGTKFNAVYWRKKTRDLFDMDDVFRHAAPAPETVLRSWRRYKRELDEELPSWSEYCREIDGDGWICYHYGKSVRGGERLLCPLI